MTCSASCRNEVRPACWDVVGIGTRKGAPPATAWGLCASVALGSLWLEASRRCLRRRRGHTMRGLSGRHSCESLRGPSLLGRAAQLFPLLLRRRIGWGPGSQESPTQGGAGLCSESGAGFTGGRVGAGRKLWWLRVPCGATVPPLLLRGLSSPVCKMGHQQSLLFAMPHAAFIECQQFTLPLQPIPSFPPGLG